MNTPWIRLGLRHRILLLVGALVVFLICLDVIARIALDQRDEVYEAEQSRIDPLRETADALLGDLYAQQNGVRGFLITQDRRALDPYRAGSRASMAHLAEMRELARGHARITRHIAQFEQALRAWQQEVAERQIRLVIDDHASAAFALEEDPDSTAVFMRARAEIADLRAAVRSMVAQANRDRLAARQQVNTLLWTADGISVLFAAVVALLLRRWITDPLRRISAAISVVTAGDRHHAIPATGPAELASLATNVEAMRAETVRQLDEAVRARQALEQQGTAVVTLRAELAPSPIPMPPSLRFAGRLEPAEGDLAGDWYDFVATGSNRVVLMLVDVSGHGPAAGVFALRAKHLLGAAAGQGLAPGDMLQWFSAHIGDTAERFLTGFVAEVDASAGRVRYANAGHPPAVLMSEGLARLPPTGPLLGPLPGVWETAEMDLPAGAKLVVHTDGLLEARDTRGVEFGEERLNEVLLRDCRNASVDATVNACLTAVKRFTGGRTSDDLTVVALERVAGD